MIVEVRLKTGAKLQKIEQISEGIYSISVCKQPVENEANKQLVKVLSDYFKVAKSLITIKSGHHSRIKILEIDN